MAFPTSTDNTRRNTSLIATANATKNATHNATISDLRRRFDNFKPQRPTPNFHKDLKHGWMLPVSNRVKK